MNRISAELVAMARDLVAAAGPYTLLEQLQDDLRRGKLEDERHLKMVGMGFGHTKGADYIFGQEGEDIVYALIGYEAGRKTKEETLDIIMKNLPKALKDNEPFKGLRGEQIETHNLWMKMMGEKRGRKAADGIPSLGAWNRYAGGTSVPEQYHSYDLYTGNLQYSITPFSTQYGRFVGYFLGVFPGNNHGHAGIAMDGSEVMINSRGSIFRNPNIAVQAARRHYESQMVTASEKTAVGTDSAFHIIRDLGKVEETLAGMRFDILHVLMSPEEWKDIYKSIESIEKQVEEIEKTTVRMVRQNMPMAASDLTAKYPQNVTEQDRKKWREQAEKRRRHEGIRPRKGAKWQTLPRGWTQDSLKSFWHSLAGEGSIPKRFHRCQREIEKTDITDSGAFCGALFDRMIGDTDWRAIGR